MAELISNIRGPQGPPGPPGPGGTGSGVVISDTEPTDPPDKLIWVQPVDAATELTVAFFSDVQDETSDARERATRAALDAVQPDLWMFLGDMFYDQPNSGGISLFDAVWGDLVAQGPTKIRPLHGNHDITPTSTLFDAYWAGFLGPNGERWYSFDLPNGWHVIALAANGTDWPTSGSTQYQWLAADLAANQTKPTFVVAHWPRWNQGTHGPGTNLGPAWTLFDANPQVQFAIGGHQHIYQRFPPLSAAGTPDPDGTTQIVTPTTEYVNAGRTLTTPGQLVTWAPGDANWGGVAVKLYPDHWESRVIEGAGNPSWGPNIGQDVTTWIDHPFRSGPVTPPANPNLMVNGSFETDIATWTASSNMTLARSTIYAHDGQASLQITSAVTQASKSLAGINSSAGRVPVSPGDQVTISAWFRCGATARSLALQVTPFNSAGTTITEVYGAAAPGAANDWRQVTETAIMPAGAATVGLWFRADNIGTGEQMWIDDVVLTKTGGAS